MRWEELAERLAALECSTNSDFAKEYNVTLADADDIRENLLSNVMQEAVSSDMTGLDIAKAQDMCDAIFSTSRGDRRRAGL